MTLDENGNEIEADSNEIDEDSIEDNEVFLGSKVDHMEETIIGDSLEQEVIIGETSKKKANGKSLIYDLIFYVLLIFISLYILPNYVIQRTIVDGTSMENTLHDGEHLFVEKVSYHFKELDRFDIIVFYPYGRENGDYYVKRIIGLPGEGVQIVNGEIYINGSLLEEDYGKDDWEESGRAEDLIILGDDEYFVLGDNRAVSKDSRDSEVGNVLKDNIGGRVIFRMKPFNKIGTID